jgi:NAD-dependent deacetylase
MEWEHGEALNRARALVRDASRVAAFTGAGISAESGIPTYRDSNDSLWQKYDAEKIAHIDYFMRNPTEYWHFFQDARYRVMSRAKPNPGHAALAAMEKAGKLRCVITQNIDGLHQMAGSQQVTELHGNTRRIKCLSCGKNHGFDEIYELLQKELPPPCKACGGMLKPDVVFFGEALPEAAFSSAVQAADECDLLISIGSSLVVYPAALLPERAKAGGAGLIIVNKTPTPFDPIADAVVRAAASEVLPVLAAAAGVAVKGKPETARGTESEID